MIKYRVPGIGQGCCVEQVLYFNGEKYRIIYDCGSENIEVLENYIDNLDTGIQTILVISHLHRDHINCIPYLLNRLKNIEQIYLPYYREEVLKLFAMSIIYRSTENTVEENAALIRFIQNIQYNEGFDNLTHVISHDIAEEDRNIIGGNIERERKKSISDSDVPKIPPKSDKIFWAIKFWVDKDVYRMLSKEDKELLERIKWEDLRNEKKHEDLRKIYKKIVKDSKTVSNSKIDFNQTSMLMASYLKLENMPCRICHFPLRCFRACCHSHNGFICTGDYPFKDTEKVEKIREHYSNEDMFIRQMTVPHHGSGNGYCEKIPFKFIKKAYAQNGHGNKYKHPHQDTIDFFNNKDIKFINRQEVVKIPECIVDNKVCNKI
jgi:ribonuclease BN (tRNA processing enzyme)